jgi:hypothetical protein
VPVQPKVPKPPRCASTPPRLIEGYTVYTDVVQALCIASSMSVDDMNIYINPTARYPCPLGMVLKLLKANGLIQAPVKFKQGVIDWFKGNGYLAANDAQTIWIKRDKMGVIIHALYAGSFFHFTKSKALYQDFQKQFRKHFDVKIGSVGVYLGNLFSVDHAKNNRRIPEVENSVRNSSAKRNVIRYK